MKLRNYVGLLVLTCVMFSACGAYMHQPMRTTKARLGEETQSTQLLKALPTPSEKIYAAVYKFRDQTGQYRPSSTGASWSTAVTQGATNILIRALENSNWFVPVERENVSNLLNERKIILNSRAQYSKGNGGEPQLPPLLFAGIILEGGIVSYDANILTGGVGARYFGAGGSAQYRQDRVSVYLRAISTQNGRILKTVYTSKTILSQAIDASLFRFVSFQKLLEAETGFTYNEPSELAVTEAIEKAVYALILEGVQDNLWPLEAEPQDSTALMKAYSDELSSMQVTDQFGRVLKHRRGKWSMSLAGQVGIYNGDLLGPSLTGGLHFDSEVLLSPHVGVGIETGFSKFKVNRAIDDFYNYVNVYSKYRVLPFDRWTPYLRFGIGTFSNSGSKMYSFSGSPIGQVTYGGGFEFMASDRVGLHAEVSHQLLFNDKADNIEQGKYNDMYYRLSAGVRYYFGQSPTTKIDGYE